MKVTAEDLTTKLFK